MSSPGARPYQDQQYQYQQQQSPQSYGPRITFQEAAGPSSTSSPHHQHQRQLSHHNQYHQPPNSVPTILQPGQSPRTQAASVDTTGVLPPLQGNVQQQPQPDYPPTSTSTKSAHNMSHAYSRSSPAAGYDTPGSYQPYTTTPGGSASGAGGSSSQFMSPTDIPRYGAPTSGRAISNTPLGLADIRPRADSSMSEGAPGSLGYDIANAQPGTSNYMAPWPMYAFDWCKWRPQGNGAGKLAVGSYLEDGHNFVSQRPPHDPHHDSPRAILTVRRCRFKYSTVTSHRHHQMSTRQDRQSIP